MGKGGNLLVMSSLTPKKNQESKVGKKKERTKRRDDDRGRFVGGRLADFK